MIWVHVLRQPAPEPGSSNLHHAWSRALSTFSLNTKSPAEAGRVRASQKRALGKGGPIGELDQHLAWTRQVGTPGYRGVARLVDQLSNLRALTIDPAVPEGVHADRVRLMVREGTWLSAQYLKVLTPLETISRLTDEVVGMFDRLIGKLFRRAERRAAEDLRANARAINEKLRLLVKLRPRRDPLAGWPRKMNRSTQLMAMPAMADPEATPCRGRQAGRNHHDYALRQW
jgi:hypothetical protein